MLILAIKKKKTAFRALARCSLESMGLLHEGKPEQVLAETGKEMVIF